MSIKSSGRKQFRKLTGMKQYKNVLISVGAVYLFTCILIGYFISKIHENNFDTVAINDIVQTAVTNWDDIGTLNDRDFGFDYVILDNNNDVKYSSSEKTVSGIAEAVKKEYVHAPIVDDGRYYGNVVVLMGGQIRAEKILKQTVAVMTACMALILIVFVVFLVYIKKSIVDPFTRLKEFAGLVAEGNLDVPLAMDKTNLFGAFSESFDIMREELKMSRKRENDLKIKEKEMIASLSHDLKTPITGIRLTCELLNVKLEKDEDKEKVDNIYSKAEQIDALVSDLFTTTLEDLGEIKVQSTDENSKIIGEIVRKTDVKLLTEQSEIPECMILVDKRRLEQIISNIISNSYKYANTKISVTYSIIEGYLKMSIRDFGNGVSEDEIHLVTNKFFRGSVSKETVSDGSGLGLYISKTLIEKMNGEIRCALADPGFEVMLLIPLS